MRKIPKWKWVALSVSLLVFAILLAYLLLKETTKEQLTIALIVLGIGTMAQALMILTIKE